MRTTLMTLTAGLALSPFAGAAERSSEQEVDDRKVQVALLLARMDALERNTDAPGQEAVTGAQPHVAPERFSGAEDMRRDAPPALEVRGRVHVDAYAFDPGRGPVAGSIAFRRARITLQGEVRGWRYKFEQDFAADHVMDGFRDVHVSRQALGGRFTIGHFKPYRAMEELTSSNEILMMERPFASASGLFSGRQFQQGVGYLRAGGRYTAGVSVFNLRSASGRDNRGTGAAGRVTWAPLSTDERTLHLGGWASREHPDRRSADIRASVRHAGRRGPSRRIATTAGASGGDVTALGLEVAGSAGPLFFQAEYVNARFGQASGQEQDVTSWYVQGAWLLDGGHRAYKSGSGVFASPKVAGRSLWELSARYDTIENRDIPGLDARSWVIGLNYYVDPRVRVMFNYTRGTDGGADDRAGQYALRAQFAW